MLRAPAALCPLLAALLAPDPSKRRVMLRLQPPYLPHPLLRLAGLPGVVRGSKPYGWLRHGRGLGLPATQIFRCQQCHIPRLGFWATKRRAGLSLYDYGSHENTPGAEPPADS